MSTPAEFLALRTVAQAPPAASSAQARQDLRACVALMRGGSKTFFAASRLLPAHLRDASIALYAFCRVADDLVDEGDDAAADAAVGTASAAAQTAQGLRGLDELRRRLDAIYAGQPLAWVEDRALAAVVSLYRLPRPLLDALLEGFAWDAQGRRYESLEDVQAYAARVAASVGAMMAWLMGVRDPLTLSRACELGVAMQLTNIARDVGTDARMGRIYLPRQWLREAGISPDAWLREPRWTPALARVVDRLLQEADRLYAQAACGIAALPPDCRPAIRAAGLIYAEIGHQLRRQRLDAVHQRAVVSGWRKAWLLLVACVGRERAPVRPPAPLAACAFLVAHCQNAPLPVRPSGAMRRPWGERTAWTLELFERQAQLRRRR